MHHFVAVAASLVAPTISGAEATQLILRWFHIIAGIAWVGLLYFFNLINVPFMKQVDASIKSASSCCSGSQSGRFFSS